MPKDFFETLYPQFDKSNLVVEIRAIHMRNRQRIKRRFCSSISELVASTEELLAEKVYDIYFECPELKAGAKHGQKENLERFPFLYADLDSSKKDRMGKIVFTYTRDEMLQKIENFPLTPSLIVDSGHGFHVYWRLNGAIREPGETEVILKRIAQELCADSKASLITQLLRVPETFNLKEVPSGKSALPVYVVKSTPSKYTKQDFVKALKITKEELEAPKQAPLSSSYLATPVFTDGRDLQFSFSKKPSPLGITVDNFPDLLHLLRRQNLFLASNQPNHELGKTFQCVFHADNNPSANVYQTAAGEFFYKCFAAESASKHSCNAVHYDVINVCQILLKKSFAQAILHLCDFFGITFKQEQWYWDQLKKYHENAMFLEQFEDYGYDEAYPHFFKMIKPRLIYLKLLNHYALSRVSSAKYNYQGENLFFFSYRHFSRINNLGLDTVQRNVNTLALLGLIKKVDPAEVPADLIKKAQTFARKEESMKRHGRPILNPVNFYIMPNLHDSVIEAEEIAKKLRYFNMKNMMNKEYLLQNFTKEKANEVYHDEREISKKNLSISNRLEATLVKLVQENGFATKDLVVSKTKVSGRLNVDRQQKERELDKSFANILQKHSLQYIRANKEMQQQFRLKTMGYVIVPSK